MASTIDRRPRPAKIRAITEAATATFLADGYEGASLDHIAARAGVSKQTIYNHFADKESLFRAICAGLTTELMESLRPEKGLDEDPAVTLRRLGLAYLDLALRPSSLALHRLIIGETARFPELGRAIYNSGPARVVAELAEFLDSQTRAGRLQTPHPKVAAEQFLGMLIGHNQLRALLGVADVRRATAARRVGSVVEAFMRAFAARRSGTVADRDKCEGQIRNEVIVGAPARTRRP
jgi:TetR/AcrR family transcriptional repressor of mexJK operon